MSKSENSKNNFIYKISFICALLTICGAGSFILFAFYINPDNFFRQSSIPLFSSEQRNLSIEKPVILENYLPDTNPELESLGDKLAQAGWHLRQSRSEIALKYLNEAQDKTAIYAKDDLNENRILWRDLNNRVSQAENDLQMGNSNKVVDSIEVMLLELDTNQK